MRNKALRTTIFRLTFVVAGLLIVLIQPHGLLAAPTAKPTVTLDVPKEGFIGEPITFTATFDNDPSDNAADTITGYGPYVDLYMPISGADGTASAGTNDGLTFTSATFLGAPVTSTIIDCPSGTTIPSHPLTDLPINCLPRLQVTAGRLPITGSWSCSSCPSAVSPLASRPPSSPSMPT